MLTGIPGPTLIIPPPRYVGGAVLYLDFDSVLHPGDVYIRPGEGPFLLNRPGHELFEHAPLLDQLLAPYPDVRIVLSTSWVRHYRGRIPRTAARLPPGLSSRVVGATYHSEMLSEEFMSTSRGMQVWSDVLRRNPRRWLAIDDDDERWPAWCRDKLVRTDEVQGISEPTVLAELKAKLEETFGDAREPDGAE